ncbi:MAG TPA: hypothetical protein VJI15_01355 [Candidatus Nanoarchaeia archaeon]|nr:hypothetical protein [Candidatus Nanoarchaeia archaeon]
MFIRDIYGGFGMDGYPLQSTPHNLCRVVMGELIFDAKRYLLSHEGCLGIGQYDPRSVPLCHPGEWETMARWLYVDMGHSFTLLTVDSSKIVILSRKEHQLLRHGEFFALVHEDAIQKSSRYVWSSGKTIERLTHIPPEVRMFYINRFKECESKVPVLEEEVALGGQ